jgi:hypothetical protein
VCCIGGGSGGEERGDSRRKNLSRLKEKMTYGTHMSASGGREVARVFWTIWKMRTCTMVWQWAQTPQRHKKWQESSRWKIIMASFSIGEL